ncbi:hypothetical protein B0H14DRAFT_2591918 [Mycena olivaceomarginata]|nr:hypothetical protein B0H14DRAFT_2591918 [Mycena olivaceomarginata]
MTITSQQTKIAIVGVAAQLPSGEFSNQDLSYQTLWDFLLKKGQGSQPLSPEIFSSSKFGGVRDKLELPTRGAFLKAHDRLDSVAFGISTKDARVMPFTARRLMELSFEALLDSGIDYRRKKVGCFMSGIGNFDVAGAISTEGSFASAPSALANRISYMLDITGPSLQLDTACSSSLTALHLAIRAIEAGDCMTALVGAAQINRHFARGEGAVVVVLKPLEDALRDNDYVYSVILGSATNSAGSRMPLSVPSAWAQKECIEMAYARAGREVTDADLPSCISRYKPSSLTSGTSVGDPIEANAAGEVFARSEYLDVGTVKGNVGHLEAAAFLVSLLKACLILENKIIPPTVNLSVPSPAIDWDKHRLRVPTEPTPLGCRSASGRSIISLSGAGIGGSTGHVVIESPPARAIPRNRLAENDAVTLVVGGLSPKAVAHICNSIRDANISSIETMRSCAVTLSRRVRQLPWRTYFTMPLPSDAEIPPATLVPASPPPVAFIFSGQGPQNLDMGRGLFAAFPVFKSTILELDDVYRRVVGVSLVETTGLFVSSASPPSIVLPPTGWPVTITVSSIAMLQMALFDLLVSVGITPSSLAGHSAGETAILYASGAGSRAMALEIAIARGQAMTATESSDLGMASLACNVDVAKEIISGISGTLEISCFNAPNSVALSGYLLVILAHTSPKSRCFPRALGRALVDEFSPAYFWDNCRNPVLFSPAISSLLDFHTDSDPIFLELSCHAVLSSSIYPHGISEKSVLCPMRRGSATNADSGFTVEQTLFTETLARITLLGYNSCDLSGLYGASVYKPSFIGHPLVSRSITSPKMQGSDVHPTTTVNGPLSGNVPINELTHPLLAQHVINGEPILPATAFIEILLEGGATSLWDVEFLSVYSLSARNPVRMVLERSGCNWSLKSMGAVPAVSPNLLPQMETSKEHSHGLMDCLPVKSAKSVDLKSIWDRLPQLEMQGFYESLQPFATFGPAFQNVLRCHGGPTEVIAEVRGPSLDESSNQYRLHPPTLDACLHIMLHPRISKQYGDESMYLPSKLGRFVYHNVPGSGNWFSHIRRRFWSPDSRSYDIVVTNGSGAVICEFQNLLVQKLSAPPPSIGRRLDLIFQPVSVPVTTKSRTTYSERGCYKDEEALFKVLDSLALVIISKSFQRQIVVGEDLSRQRYFEFAQRALEKNAGKILPVIQDEKEMRTKYPAHFEVTSRISDVHEMIFQSSKSAVDSLYSDDLMTRFYRWGSQTSTVYEEAARSFSCLLDSLQSSGKYAINILEVGAGVGLLTTYLIGELKQKPHLLAEYTVTDTSYVIYFLRNFAPFLNDLQALASELAHTVQYHKTTPKIYDITKDAGSQGLLPESYDIIVTSHVLHVAPDIRSCLSSFQGLLVPGGSLFVVELDGTSWGEKVGSVWFDCVFGAFSEWFAFADGRTHCTMSPASWMEKLEDVGFINAHASVEPGNGGHNFLFTAQKPAAVVQAAIPDGAMQINPDHVLQYSFGNEMELQSHLNELSPKEHIDLYLVALEGRDGHSAMGLCATLQREFPFWEIRLAIFESATHLSNPLDFISIHRGIFNHGEKAVLFPCEGSPRVSRVILSPSPAIIPDDYPLPLVDSDHLVIELIASEATAVSIHGFVGRVLESRLKTPSPGDLVVGLADQNTTPIFVAHVGCVALLEAQHLHDHPNPAELTKVVAPALILASLPKRRPHSRIRVVVAVLDENMSHSIATHLGTIQTVTVVQCEFRDDDSSRLVDVVISDLPTSTRYPHIRHWVPRSGRFILWDDLLRDNIRNATWEISHALQPGLLQLPAMSNGQLLPLAKSVSGTHLSLFRHDRSYILLGGIGGLGVDLAVWMYQVGPNSCNNSILCSFLNLSAELDTSSSHPERVSPPLTHSGTPKPYRKSGTLEDARIFCFGLNHVTQRTHAQHHCSSEVSVSLSRAVFQMTLVLSDGLFLKQTQANFTAVYDSKIKVFEVFAAEVEIDSLDFYIAFSSFTGLIGYAGRATMQGILSNYRNAFSLVVPAILDAGYLDRADSINKTGGIFAAASMSAAHLWACIQDGLHKIRDGSAAFTRYIPDVDWATLHTESPLSLAFNHLLPAELHSSAVPGAGLKSEEDILQLVLSFVEVDKEDFDFDRPLLSYGLDSLSATRLSSTLQPFIQVSQVQLLAGISWSELREILLSTLGVDEADFDPNIPLISYGLDPLSASKLATALRPHLAVTQLQLLARTTWTDLLASNDISPATQDGSYLSGETIVEICSGPGIPLILFSGGDGRLAPLLSLRANFSVTEATPTTPFSVLASFFAEKIHQKQPHGPYRLAAFSASSVISVAVAKLLEESGEQVLQLAFIDGFPLLWINEDTELPLREQELSTLVDRPIGYMIDMLRNDPLHRESTHIMELEAALSGAPHAAAEDIATVEAARRLTAPLLQFLVTFYPEHVVRSYSGFTDSFTRWVASVNAPLSVIMAEFGTIITVPKTSRAAWVDLEYHDFGSHEWDYKLNNKPMKTQRLQVRGRNEDMPPTQPNDELLGCHYA